MVAPEHACWNALVHSDMALACAVDPEACNVPDAHAMPPVDPAGPADPAAGVVPEDDVLLSEPHAVNVSVPATITAAAPIRRVRLTTFTVPSSVGDTHTPASPREA